MVRYVENTTGTYVKMILRATFFSLDNSVVVTGKPPGFL